MYWFLGVILKFVTMTRILQSWYLWKNPSNNMGNFTKPRAVVKKHLLQSPLEHHNHSCMSNPYPAWLPEIQWWNLAIWRLEGTYAKELPCLKLMKRFHFWLHEPLPILEAQEACAALCILAAAKACPNGEKPCPLRFSRVKRIQQREECHESQWYRFYHFQVHQLCS